jgi:NADPH:quinone reductase-like Zn-dependent oxidoreductase
MRAVQYSEFGEPELLQVVEIDEPHAGPDQVRVVVRAVGVNAIDWKVSSGAMGGELPGRIGSEVAGVVDEVGENITDATAGDEVFGPATGGAADFALLSDYAHIPATLDFAGAAALPVAVETATRGLEELGVRQGTTLLINGASGGVGTAAVQFAVARGATVIATASESNHERLRGYGALVTTYGDGLAERVAELAPGGAQRVFDFAAAGEAGVKLSGGPGTTRHWESLDHAAALVGEGKLVLPVQQTFLLEQVADAERLSQTGHLRGKLVLLVD